MENRGIFALTFFFKTKLNLRDIMSLDIEILCQNSFLEQIEIEFGLIGTHWNDKLNQQSYQSQIGHGRLDLLHKGMYLLKQCNLILLRHKQI